MIRGKWPCLVLLGISLSANALEITCHDNHNNQVVLDLRSDMIIISGDEIVPSHGLEVLLRSREKILAASQDGFFKVRINREAQTLLFHDYKADKRLFYTDCR